MKPSHLSSPSFKQLREGLILLAQRQPDPKPFSQIEEIQVDGLSTGSSFQVSYM